MGCLDRDFGVKVNEKIFSMGNNITVSIINLLEIDRLSFHDHIINNNNRAFSLALQHAKTSHSALRSSVVALIK